MYLLTALYNAPLTKSHYCRQEVLYDMFGGGWEEKGIFAPFEFIWLIFCTFLLIL